MISVITDCDHFSGDKVSCGGGFSFQVYHAQQMQL